MSTVICARWCRLMRIISTTLRRISYIGLGRIRLRWRPRMMISPSVHRWGTLVRLSRRRIVTVVWVLFII